MMCDPKLKPSLAWWIAWLMMRIKSGTACVEASMSPRPLGQWSCTRSEGRWQTPVCHPKQVQSVDKISFQTNSNSKLIVTS